MENEKNEIKIVGAAYPRTGTMTVKKALEILNLGKSYHMHEFFLNLDHVEVWEKVKEGIFPDWNEFLNGYSATLDTPACFFWKEIYESNPGSKVLLLKRDPEKWYDSVLETVYPIMVGEMGKTNPALKLVKHLFVDIVMQGKFDDKDFAMNVYKSYCDEVVSYVPEEDLLIYNVKEGWEPLCEFFDCETPEITFPKKNSRGEFKGRNKI